MTRVCSYFIVREAGRGSSRVERKRAVVVDTFARHLRDKSLALSLVEGFGFGCLGTFLCYSTFDFSSLLLLPLPPFSLLFCFVFV